MNMELTSSYKGVIEKNNTHFVAQAASFEKGTKQVTLL